MVIYIREGMEYVLQGKHLSGRQSQGNRTDVQRETKRLKE